MLVGIFPFSIFFFIESESFRCLISIKPILFLFVLRAQKLAAVAQRRNCSFVSSKEETKQNALNFLVDDFSILILFYGQKFCVRAQSLIHVNLSFMVILCMNSGSANPINICMENWQFKQSVISHAMGC